MNVIRKTIQLKFAQYIFRKFNTTKNYSIVLNAIW